MFVCTLVVIILQVKSLSALTMTILTAPLGLAGVVPTLLIFHVPFGFNPILGLIALAGILMRNTPYRRNRGRHCTYARFSPALYTIWFRVKPTVRGQAPEAQPAYRVGGTPAPTHCTHGPLSHTALSLGQRPGLVLTTRLYPRMDFLQADFTGPMI